MPIRLPRNVLIQAIGAGELSGLEEARGVVRRSFGVETYRGLAARGLGLGTPVFVHRYAVTLKNSLGASSAVTVTAGF